MLHHGGAAKEEKIHPWPKLESPKKKKTATSEIFVYDNQHTR